jgi:hypothetical protein
MRHRSAPPLCVLLAAFCCAGFIADAQATSDGPTTVSFTPAVISAHGGTTTLYFFGSDGNNAHSASFRMRMPVGLAAPVASGNDIAYTPSGCDSSAMTSSNAGTGTLTFQGSMSTTGMTGGCGFSVVLTATQPFNYDSANDSLWSITDGAAHYYPQATLRAVANAPTASIAFAPTSVAFEGASRLTVTIANTDASFALSGVALAITLPVGIVVGSPSDLNSNCGGTASAVAGGSTLGFTGAALTKSGPPGDTCTFSVVVHGIGAGTQTATAQISANEIQTVTKTSALIVATAPTTTTLATACMTTYVDAAPRQPFTLSAAVAGMNPGGSVTFADAELAGTLCGGPVALNAGTASCTTGLLGAGVHRIAANYEPDANHDASYSTFLRVTVLSASDAIFRNGYEADVANCPVE